MRAAFINTLYQLAKRDSRIVLLTGDLGFMVFEKFAQEFPDRFINVGVAEQNMVGIATGLAEAGYIPFVYSIAPFATLRPLEFIRNGPVLHKLPVRVVGMGGGFEYGHAGPSHFALEDLAVMRSLAEITVIGPADSLQVATALEATYDLSGPIYYRLGKDDRREVPGLIGKFVLGEPSFVCEPEGSKAVLVSTGAISLEAVKAAQSLTASGTPVAVAVVSTLQTPSVGPIPRPEMRRGLAENLREFSLVVSIEAHQRCGGLGDLVSEALLEAGLSPRVVRHGVDTRLESTGSQRFLESSYGLSSEVIAQLVHQSLPK